MHWLNHHLLAPLVSGDWFFGRFLLRLSRIKRPQSMSTVKFSPTTLNFGYDFVLLVHFFGTSCTFYIDTPNTFFLSAMWCWNHIVFFFAISSLGGCECGLERLERSLLERCSITFPLGHIQLCTACPKDFSLNIYFGSHPREHPGQALKSVQSKSELVQLSY